MKTLKTILSLLFVLALGLSLFLTSCSKEDESLQDSGQPAWTVRPDFATLDNRPPEIIAQFRVTEKDAVPVELSTLKGSGKYALVIGISDYQGTASDLSYCDDDATDWGAKLQAEHYSVTALLDRYATKASIEAAVNDLASLAAAGNDIALCYSGHGSKGNIVTTDLYYISSAWFKTKFANATSTKMMFCFDACQIGAMAADLNGSGRVIAVASNKTSYSYDGDATQKNGVFTYFQMKGFDVQKYLYLEPDCQYACDEMIKWARIYRLRVVPSYVDSYTGNFDF